MANINNGELSQQIQDATGIQSAVDGFPNQLGNAVIPIIDVNPKGRQVPVILGSSTKTTTGNQTLFTAHSSRDTYITGIAFSLLKDASCDEATGTSFIVQATINGTSSTPIVQIGGITLTAQQHNGFISFGPIGIKVDRASVVAIAGNSFTAGVKVRSANVYGYEVSTAYAR